jgi:hypothetical protein
VLAGSLELSVAGGVDGVPAADEDVVGGDVADGAVEAAGVVVVDEVSCSSRKWKTGFTEM